MITKEMWEDRFVDNELTEKYFQLCSISYDGEGENHHILPKSMWPEFIDSKWNLVRLSYQDHYNAHEMLAKICIRNEDELKMLKAWSFTCHTKEGLFVDADEYAILRVRRNLLLSQSMKGNKSHRYGTKHSDETKNKMSEKAKSRTHTEETKRKISLLKSGENNPVYGKRRSREFCEKISEVRLNMPVSVCGKCGFKSRNSSIMVRFHGQNCKWIDILCVETGETFKNGQEINSFLQSIGKPPNYHNIVACCNGATERAYGYHWRYATESDLDQSNNKDV